MPSKCCIPFCEGNSPGGPKVSTFSFPRDKEILQKWIHAIQKEDFHPNKNSRVCSLHFQESDIEKEISAYDPKTGRTLTAPLGKLRLKKGVVPSIFDVNNPYRYRGRKINLGNVSHSPGPQQSMTSLEPNNYQLKDSPKSNVLLRPESIRKLGKMPGSEETQRHFEGSTLEMYPPQNSELTLSSNLSDGNHSLSESSLPLPEVLVKSEVPWEEEYNYVENTSCDKSKESDKMEIKIKEVWSLLNSSYEKADRNKAESSGSSSASRSSLKLRERDNVFGRLIACEMSSLRKNPETYFKAKQAILDTLVQAHVESVKCKKSILL